MDNIKNDEILGRNIREIRNSLNLTQEKFSELLYVNSHYLSQVENGKVGISIDTAINICKIANCSPSLLFKDIIQSPDIIKNYDLLNDRDKSIINQIILYLLNTK